MKKSLVKLARALAFTTVLPAAATLVTEVAPIQVQAAATIDFEQGSKSDEEYVRDILKQFNELDAYHSEMKDEVSGGTTTTTYDSQTGGTKVESYIPASEYSDEMTMTYYFYDDGTMIYDELGYLKSSASYMSLAYPDYEAQLKTVEEQMGDALVLTPPSEAAEELEDIDVTGTSGATDELFVPEDLVFQEVTKEGDVVTATVDMSTYIEENPELAEFYPANTQYSMTYSIDPAAQTITSTMTIDVDESAMEESSDDDLGISLASLITDSTVVIVTQATDEKVPAIEDLNTITEEEFDQILQDAGLDLY